MEKKEEIMIGKEFANIIKLHRTLNGFTFEFLDYYNDEPEMDQEKMRERVKQEHNNVSLNLDYFLMEHNYDEATAEERKQIIEMALCDYFLTRLYLDGVLRKEMNSDRCTDFRGMIKEVDRVMWNKTEKKVLFNKCADYILQKSSELQGLEINVGYNWSDKTIRLIEKPVVMKNEEGKYEGIIRHELTPGIINLNMALNIYEDVISKQYDNEISGKAYTKK